MFLKIQILYRPYNRTYFISIIFVYCYIFIHYSTISWYFYISSSRFYTLADVSKRSSRSLGTDLQVIQTNTVDTVVYFFGKFEMHFGSVSRLNSIFYPSWQNGLALARVFRSLAALLPRLLLVRTFLRTARKMLGGRKAGKERDGDNFTGVLSVASNFFAKCLLTSEKSLVVSGSWSATDRAHKVLAN